MRVFPGKVRDFAFVNDGSVWLVYGDSVVSNPGVALYSNGNWQKISIMDESIKNNDVSEVYATDSGDIWLFSRNGLFKFSNNNWELKKVPGCQEKQNQGLSRTINLGRDGILYVTCNENIARLVGKLWVTDTVKVDDYTGLGGVASDSNGTVFYRSGFIQNGIQFYFSNLPFYQINDIQIAPDGSVWYGTEFNGLFVFDNKE
jgi:ligand-binding sensor domain-containing protein